MYIKEYNRAKAVEYAHQWAYGRNHRYLDFTTMGGDCTNFTSQCIYAGAGVMNYKPDTGWYYISASRRAPSWTGVEFLYKFLIGNRDAGPFATVTECSKLLPGDLVQLSFDGKVFGHSLVVVAAENPNDSDGILVATHTYDWDNRALDSYTYEKKRCLHIEGVRVF